MPYLNAVQKYECRDGGAGGRGQHLGEDDHAAFVHAVSDRSRPGGEDEHGQQRQTHDQPQLNGAARQLIDEPAHGGPPHPGADQRNALADKKEAVISDSQGGKGLPEAAPRFILRQRSMGGIGQVLQ